MVDLVCGACGTPIAETRSGRWLHVESPPDNVDDHEAERPVTRRYWIESRSPAATLKLAASDLLQHHLTGHALIDCRWAQNLRDALRMDT